MPPLLLDPYVDLILVVIPGAFALFAWLDLRLARKAGHSPTVPGRILSRAIDQAASAGRNSYYPVIRYRYTVEGATYEGSRLSFRTYWTAAGASRTAYHYSPGQHVTVHYSPDNPQRSVLSLDRDDRAYVRLLLSLPIVALGLALLLWRAAA